MRLYLELLVICCFTRNTAEISFKVAGALFCEDKPAIGVGMVLREGAKPKSHSETTSTGEFYVVWKGEQSKKPESWFIEVVTECKKKQKKTVMKIPDDMISEEGQPSVVYDVGVVDISRIEDIGISKQIVVQETRK